MAVVDTGKADSLNTNIEAAAGLIAGSRFSLRVENRICYVSLLFPASLVAS